MTSIYLSDLHLHSSYSFDGEVSLTNICETALKRGMQEIAITDHADIYANKPYEHILDADSLYQELAAIKEQYKDRLLVRLGAELGQPQRNPSDAARFLSSYPLDFVIGSIHNVEDDFDIYDYDYTTLDCGQMYDHYLDWVLDLAEHYDYDVIGHLTYPLRCMAEVGIRLDLAPFEEKFRTLFDILIERKKGIELNTSGLYQTINDTMPPLSLLKLYQECGGQIITLGSDAHHIPHISLPIQQGVLQLKKAGFTEYCTYQNRKPVFHSLG